MFHLSFAPKSARPICFVLVLVMSGFCHAVGQDDPFKVLPDDREPRAMMQNWLMSQADGHFDQWEKNYDALQTKEQIEAYQKQRREFFLRQLGGLPERTPLRPQITGTIERDGYRIEKVLFESQPGFVVSSALFIPDAEHYEAPYPGVLVVCGHSSQAKAYEAYQTACALLARNGVAALIIDPVGQGERYQHLDEEGNIELPSTTAGHSLLGLGSILLGQNTARFEVWDGMRAIDYLESRDDIDATRIGCMGNSGGGTQTSYLMALEDRIVAASPACYITSFEKLLETIGPQDAEQNIYGQIAAGMDHADYLFMRAPTPVLICCATNDFFHIEGTWESFRSAKRIFARQGFPEHIELVETANTHGWHQPLREAAVRWMVRWLAGRDEPIVEEGIELIDEKELWASPEGQVLRLPNARSAFDLNIETNLRFREARQALWREEEAALRKVREVSGIASLDDLDSPDVESLGEFETDSHTVQRIVFHRDSGIQLPALLFQPKAQDKPRAWTLFVHESGKLGDSDSVELNDLLADGIPVLAIDLRGTGETKPGDAVWYNDRFGEDAKHLMIAYLLGTTYVRLRAEDLLVCARWAVGESESNAAGVMLVASGEVGTSALHAAALESQLFQHVHIDRTLESWEEIVSSKYSQDQVVNIIHGALTSYDLPDLVRSLRDKIQLTNPR